MTKISGKWIKSYLLVYFGISLLLSVMIILRLLITSFKNDQLSSYQIVGALNVGFFYLYYYIMPAIAGLIIIANFFLWKNSERNVKPEKSSLFLIFLCLSIFFWLIDIAVNHPFSFIIFPLITLTILTFIYREKFLCSMRLLKIGIVFCLVGILLMPYIVAYFGCNHQLSIIKNQESDNERIKVVSDFVVNSHTPFWGDFGKIFYGPIRVKDDFLKFLILGVAGCGDMAFSTIKYLDFFGFDSRIVRFPGEDHMFVEVYYENEWMVIDPGYFYTLITQEKRGLKRLNEMGGLSYVITNFNNSQIDLTKNYVPTDEIVIKIIKDTLPVPNASITLKHTFLGSSINLPSFKSNVNGTLTINLGPMNYSNPSNESFYWIFVDGIETNLKATSSGSGESILIEVDITNLS